jgi:MoaA/NifB/PqqE/SkfB family radical SAM enzyme
MSINRWYRLSELGFRVLKRYPNPEIAKINLALTMRCNHRCISCNIWQLHTTLLPEIQNRDVELILERNKLLWVSLTGGEPSLASQFSEILTTCLSRVKLVNIITNGELPERIVTGIEQSLKNSLNSTLIVHVTLFGGPDKHNEMTGTRNSYSRAIDTVKGLKSIGYSNRLLLGFEHMISHYNPLEYKFVQNKANSLGIGVTYTVEQEAGYYRNKNDGAFRVHVPKINMTLNPIDLFKNSFLLNTTRKAGCVAGEYSCWVMPDLNVYPCFFSIPERNVFNLKDNNYDIDVSLFSGEREWIKRCRGCWTPCEAYTMLLFRPWRIVKIKSRD